MTSRKVILTIGPNRKAEIVIKNPRIIVEEKNLSQITDESSIEKIVDKIMESNIDKVAEAREKPKLIGWFVGQVMKESQGKANPATVNNLVKKKIGI